MRIFGCNLIEFKPLKRISPSRYYYLTRCNLKEVFINSGVEECLPSSPNKYFGIAAHGIVSKALTGRIYDINQFYEEWNNTLRDLELKLLENNFNRNMVPLNQSISLFDLKKKLLLKKISPYFTPSNNNKNIRGSNGGIEKWVQSEDGIVGGYVDQLVTGNNGIEIIDFKTGNIKDNFNQIKEEYKVQLLLYAAIIYENYKVWPISTVLKSLNGTEIVINPNLDDCIQLLKEAKKNFKKINKIILECKNEQVLMEELGASDLKVCYFCNYRPLCNRYWKMKEDNFGVTNDVKGELKYIEKLGNGTFFLKLKLGKKIYNVRAISKDKLPSNISTNDYISIYNLKKDKKENCFSGDFLTTIVLEDKQL